MLKSNIISFYSCFLIKKRPIYSTRQYCGGGVLYLSRIFNLSIISQSVKPAQPSAVSMAFLASKTVSFLVLTLFSFAPREVVPLNYASIASDDGGFKLRWAYNNDRLIFNLTCKTTGWCAVGFTTTADGKRMVNYDIALGGVASNSGYLDVSQLFQSFKSLALGSELNVSSRYGKSFQTVLNFRPNLSILDPER